MSEIPKEAIEAADTEVAKACGEPSIVIAERALKAAAPFLITEREKRLAEIIDHDSVELLKRGTFNDGLDAAVERIEKLKLAATYQGSAPLDPYQAAIDAIRALKKTDQQ